MNWAERTVSTAPQHLTAALPGAYSCASAAVSGALAPVGTDLFFGGNSFSGSNIWASDPDFVANASLRLRVFRGMFVTIPGAKP